MVSHQSRQVCYFFVYLAIVDEDMYTFADSFWEQIRIPRGHTIWESFWMTHEEVESAQKANSLWTFNL